MKLRVEFAGSRLDCFRQSNWLSMENGEMKEKKEKRNDANLETSTIVRWPHYTLSESFFFSFHNSVSIFLSSLTSYVDLRKVLTSTKTCC